MNTNSNPYPLPPGWRNFVATKENITKAWVEMNKFPILFDDFKRGDFKYFMSLFLDPDNLFLQCGDYGIAKIRGITPGANCEVYLNFWDSRFKGRQEECKMALRWLFYHFKLKRATSIIPKPSRVAIRFAKSVGFQEEGILRSSFLYKGRYLDSVVLGILKEEVFGEGLQKTNNQPKG
jgi:hypothetical protein